MEGAGARRAGIVESHEGNAYRAVYTVRFEKAVYVLHAFVELIRERLKRAQNDYEHHYAKAKR